MKKKRDFLPPNKTKMSFSRLNQCTSVEEAAANEKKDFLPPNKTKMSFLFFFYFVGARMTWRKQIGREYFRRIADA